MTPQRWQRVNDLLEQVWEHDPGERGTFLDQACAGDTELRSHVEALLTSDENIGQFLATPAVDLDSAEAAGPSGQRIGAYEIVREIGHGGMGAVFLAERADGQYCTQVAIKLVRSELSSGDLLSRFRKERQILAGLQHPNIARLLDGGATDTGSPYFVMEYVEGMPLLEYAGPLTVRQRLELFRSLCSAVQYAHEKQIVHCDLKPANILVSPGGVPKLLDFGIAKLLDPDAKGANTSLTSASMRLMTPDYASPEQVRGEPVTAATDVYSLGAVLYELLTGQRAHHVESQTPSEIEKEICTKAPKKPSALERQIERYLDNIVLMALRKEPERRYASVQQFSEDIGLFLQSMPVRARPDRLAYRGRKFLKRNRVAALAAALTAVLVLVVVAGLGRIARPISGTEAGLRSIAVLPLENLSGDPQQEYFADGITDELIGELARIHDLRVISRTSVMSYKGARSLPEIARRLGVATIAEGSVQRAGNRVRIAIRLVDAPKDRPVWSGSYEGELGNVLALQSQVARAIVGEIDASLNAPNQNRLSRDRRVNLDAYDAFLRGRHEYSSAFTLQSLQKAVAYFQKALTLDPGYAPAYAGLADCYYGFSNIYSPPTEVMPKAKSAALKAIELDDTLGDAHASLAVVSSLYDFDRPAAGKEFKRALELTPSNAQTHIWYAQHLVGMGRFDEAVAESERAQQLDPVSVGMNAYVGIPLFFAHEYDQLIQRMQPIAEAHPAYHQTHAFLALGYEQKREWAKAIAEMETAYNLDAEPEALAQLGHVYAVAGKTADARRVLKQLMELSRKRYVSAYDIAVLYAGLGEREEAFRWLLKVEQDRSEMFAIVNVDPRLDALHSDPRWQTVLSSVGLAR